MDTRGACRDLRPTLLELVPLVKPDVRLQGNVWAQIHLTPVVKYGKPTVQMTLSRRLIHVKVPIQPRLQCGLSNNQPPRSPIRNVVKPSNSRESSQVPRQWPIIIIRADYLKVCIRRIGTFGKLLDAIDELRNITGGL